MKKTNRALSVFIILSLFIGIAGTVRAGETEKININTASEKELTQLDGVGPAKAAEIVKYREENGPFGSPEDLMKVKGIGTKLFERNKDRIAAGAPEQKVSEETKGSEESDKKVSEETKASEESEQKVSEETKTSEKEKVSKEKKSSEGKESSEEE